MLTVRITHQKPFSKTGVIPMADRNTWYSCMVFIVLCLEGSSLVLHINTGCQWPWSLQCAIREFSMGVGPTLSLKLDNYIFVNYK